MGRPMHVWPEPPQETDGSVTLQATIEPLKGDRRSLWYRLPIAHQSLLTPSCDPLVVGTLFLAMRQGSDLVMHGPVSPSLLQNLEEFQTAWSLWRPDRYSKIQIQAEAEVEAPISSNPPKAISGFSGGVDSCFTALRHRKGLCGRWQRPLQATLMIHGFDIPLEEPEVFERAVHKSREMVEALDLELIPMATNFRTLPLDWEETHGAALVSCMMLLQGGYRMGLIASSDTYDRLELPYGSNPLTDGLLSSQAFQVIHDAAGVDRLQKVQALAYWPEALAKVRVCWQGKHKDRNCGQCEKCIRTILNFRVAGLGLPPCFEQDITDDQIRNLQGLGKLALIDLQLNLEAARKQGMNAPWVKALEQCIVRNQRQQQRQLWLKPLKQTVKRLLRS